MHKPRAGLIAQHFVLEDGGDVFDCTRAFHGDETDPSTEVTYNDEDVRIAVGVETYLVDVHSEDVSRMVPSEFDASFMGAVTRNLSVYTCATPGNVISDTTP